MPILAYVIIMFIVGFFLKDLIKFVLIGLAIYFVISYGWNIIPLLFNMLMGLIEMVKVAL